MQVIITPATRLKKNTTIAIDLAINLACSVIDKSTKRYYHGKVIYTPVWLRGRAAHS
jgi:hypothetical protein